jgi:hypothetical protein
MRLFIVKLKKFKTKKFRAATKKGSTLFGSFTKYLPSVTSTTDDAAIDSALALLTKSTQFVW